MGAFVACTLNPQPIPPGFKQGSATPPPTAGGSADGAGLNEHPPTDDGDAGERVDAAPPVPMLDGGNPWDGDGAADAGPDGSTDATFDAPLDAITE